MKFDILIKNGFILVCFTHDYSLSQDLKTKKWSWKLNKLQERYQQNNRPISYFEKENGKTRCVNMGIIKYSQVLVSHIFYFIL
jgi:hypothetical protein